MYPRYKTIQSKLNLKENEAYKELLRDIYVAGQEAEGFTVGMHGNRVCLIDRFARLLISLEDRKSNPSDAESADLLSGLFPNNPDPR